MRHEKTTLDDEKPRRVAVILALLDKLCTNLFTRTHNLTNVPGETNH